MATAATTPNTVPFPKHVPCLTNLLSRYDWKFLWNSEFRHAVPLQLLAPAFADPPGGERPNPNPHSRWSESHSRMPQAAQPGRGRVLDGGISGLRLDLVGAS